MKLTHLLRTACFLSINQFIGQVGTVGLLALLGHYDTQLLASFSILSANIGIFFIIATSGAVILQAEFAKLRDHIAQGTQLLTDVLLLFLMVAGFLCGFIFVVDPTILIPGTGYIFDKARDSLPLIALCIPLNAISAVVITFMEANDHAKLISKFQIAETFSMVVFVGILLLTSEPSLFSIILVNVVSAVIYLAGLLWLMHAKGLLHFAHWQLNHIKQLIKPLRISAPAVLTQLIIQYSIFILTAKVTALGATSAATLSTLFVFLFLSQILMIGVCRQMTMTVAQEQAAKRSIWPIVKTAGYALALIFAVATSILLLAPAVVGSVVTDDPSVLHMFMQSLHIAVLFCLTSFVTIFLSSLLRGLGDYSVPQIIVTIPTVGFIAYMTLTNHTLSFDYIFYTYLAFIAIDVIGLIIRLIYVIGQRQRLPKTVG